eukprot:COSAG01_NODE_85_length_27670_cov_34.051467_13_plen_246_part_00
MTTARCSRRAGGPADGALQMLQMLHSLEVLEGRVELLVRHVPMARAHHREVLRHAAQLRQATVMTEDEDGDDEEDDDDQDDAHTQQPPPPPTGESVRATGHGRQPGRLRPLSHPDRAGQISHGGRQAPELSVVVDVVALPDLADVFLRQRLRLERKQKARPVAGLLARRARDASGTATQCTRGKHSPPPPRPRRRRPGAAGGGAAGRPPSASRSAGSRSARRQTRRRRRAGCIYLYRWVMPMHKT